MCKKRTKNIYTKRFMTTEATQSNFDELIGSAGVAMVDFGA